MGNSVYNITLFQGGGVSGTGHIMRHRGGCLKISIAKRARSICIALVSVYFSGRVKRGFQNEMGHILSLAGVRGRREISLSL